MSGSWFRLVEQVDPACSPGGSGGSGRWFRSVRGVVPASQAHGSGTSDRWFRHARQVVPESLPSGSGASPAGDSEEFTKWLWRSRQVLLACQEVGSG